MLATALTALSLMAPLPPVSVEAERRIGSSGKVPAQLRTPGFEDRIAIEVRGRWSRRFPKKSFALETRDGAGGNRNVPLLGMPADDDWILYAAYNDRTLMRNVLAYDTARWLGRYAPRTRYVQLTINGRYHGLYVLMEKVKLLDERVRAGADGFLLELTSHRQSRRKDPSFRLPVTGLPVVWEDPERSDLTRRDAQRIRDRASATERALYRGAAGAWRRHLHAPAAIDHLLLNELFKNQDGMRTSTFMSGAPGKPIRLGPIWDFDHSMGQSTWGPSATLAGWMLAGRPWAERLYRDRAFARAMHRRWRELRGNGLEARLLRQVAQHERRLRAAARRDSARWPAGGDRPRGSRAGHVRALRHWLVRRIDWLDANLPRLG
jgi:CotH kinase protein